MPHEARLSADGARTEAALGAGHGELEPLLRATDVVSPLLSLLHDAHGVDFRAYKAAVIEQRIAQRLQLRRLDDPLDYLELVRRSSDELDALFRQLLIGATGFLRDRDVFESLQHHVLPRLCAARPEREAVRVWVPGCSTGEEVYSLLIALHDYLRRVGQEGGCVQVLATDVEDQALAFARRGVYSPGAAAALSDEQRERYFLPGKDALTVKPSLREAVVFARHDLIVDPPYPRIDFISCRNVLIYLERPAQRRVLQAFHYALRPQGVLLLGRTETVGECADLFAMLDPEHRIYTGKRHASRSMPARRPAERAEPRPGAATLASAPSAEHVPDALPGAQLTLERECAALRAELACRVREIDVLNDELRARDRQARLAEQQVAALLATLDVAFFVFDASQRLCSWSRRTETRFAGLSLQRGMDVAALEGPLSCSVLGASIDSALETGMASSVRVEFGGHGTRMSIVPHGARSGAALAIIAEARAARQVEQLIGGGRVS